MSEVVGGLNNGFNFYSEQSFGSCSVPCFLIYNIYNGPSDEGGNNYVIFPNPTSDEIKMMGASQSLPIGFTIVTDKR